MAGWLNLPSYATSQARADQVWDHCCGFCLALIDLETKAFGVRISIALGVSAKPQANSRENLSRATL